MRELPEKPQDGYPSIYLEGTDAPLPEKLHPGTRYMHFKTIAKGGKSVIQSCLDRHLARVVCWKQLKPEFEDDPLEQRRFVREARVSASLQHPNVIPVYELGRDARGKLYFTMKLVQGFTLRDLFAPDYRERYDLGQLVDVLVQVAFALRYAHSHGVVHRDVKPENVLVGPYGEVLLMDWGLAKVWREDGSSEDLPAPDVDPDAAATTLTGAGKLEGTIAYMSPEQLRRAPEIDHRTDVYSLGVALYEILARRAPFEGRTISEMTARIESEVPPLPSACTASLVPPPLEALAMRCLAKDPVARPAGCREVVRELQGGWER
ncbi:MAG: serine/threonine-protein kinase [Myxococcota bacterium]